MPIVSDITIIGAGVAGLSIACHLIQKNKKLRITVLEKEKLHGAGATAQCTGGIRHQFTNPLNMQLTILSYPGFLRFAGEMNYPIYLRRNGYLLVTASGERIDALAEMKNRLIEMKVPAEIRTPDELAAVYPFLRTDDLRGGSFCPLDAYADSYGVTEGYYKQCRKNGVRVLLSTAVESVMVENGAVKGVRAGDTLVESPVVINAAGPFLHKVAEMAEIKLPAEPRRRQVYVCTPLPSVPAGIPLIVDLDTGFYVHAEKNGTLLLGGTDRNCPPGLENMVDRSLLPDFIEAATARIPALIDAQITRIYTGIRSVTPDGIGILGETAVKGFYCVGGFGGNGFMHAPAVGLITACLVLGEKPPLDPAPLSPNRFTGAGICEGNLF